MRNLYNYKQLKKDSNNNNFDKFDNKVSIMETMGVEFGNKYFLLESEPIFSKLTDDEKKGQGNITAAKNQNKEKFLSYHLIDKFDEKRFNKLKIELENY